MSFLQLSNGFLNELVDYIMRDWKKTERSEQEKNQTILKDFRNAPVIYLLSLPHG